MGVRKTISLTMKALLVLAGFLLVGTWYLYLKDYREYFSDRRGALAGLSMVDAGGDARRSKSWLTITGNSGLTVDCGVLAPRDDSRRYPAIILLGGKATGKYAIDYALDVYDAVIVAVDYPYEPRESYSLVSFLSDVPAIRSALIDMVPSVMLVTDYLATRPDVDSTKIVLLGYSFGSPLIPVTVAHDRRAAAAVMVYGGGDLQRLIRHNALRYENAIISEFVAGLGALLLRPLEPMRYSDQIAPVPLLMINGTDDEQIPRWSSERFYEAAMEPKKILWLESGHVDPGNPDLTLAIIGMLRTELAEILDSKR